MTRIKTVLLLVVSVFFVTSVFAVTRNSYTKYGKHLMPNEFDPYFIDDFENCRPHCYVD
jgi:hypothetical protein